MSDKPPLRIVHSMRDVEDFLLHFQPARPETSDDVRRVEGIDALTQLVEEFGVTRVQSWLRNIAAMQGERL